MSPEEAVVPHAAAPLPAAGDALVLAPHADDEVLGCAGAICAHLVHGHAVQVVILTDGAGQAERPQARRDEARAAAAVLGYGEPECWDLPDRRLAYGEALVERLRGRIEASAARVIYAPSPWEMHPDHLALSLAATEAVRRLGGNRELVLYEIGAPLQPNRLLDLGPYLETKRRAMACFPSQLAVQHYDRHIDGLNRFRAYTLGREVEAAEAFLVTPADALRDGGLRAFHASPAARRLAQGSPVDAAEQPLVSIICRTMGRPEFADAVASVAMQTYLNIELIVVDAAARGLVLQPWCGRFPQRVVGSGGPLGRATACNAGLDAARGEYCLFLDEDDWIDPDHVAKLVTTVQRQSGAVAAFTDVAVVDAAGTLEGRVFSAPFDHFRLLSENYLPIHAVLFKHTSTTSYRMDEGLDYYEDWDFWQQLASCGVFARAPGISAYYRQGGASGVGGAAPEVPNPIRAERIRFGAHRVLGKALDRLTVPVLYDLLDRARQQLMAASDLQARLAATMAELGATRQALDASRESLAAANLERRRLEGRSALLDRLQASTSWRLTAPYRWVVRQLNRIGID